jgi:tRNA nucleotidyltransferase/poly(A) polymerase
MGLKPRPSRPALSPSKGFTIEEKTKEAIKKNSIWLEAVSQERIRDELVKIIESDNADKGIKLLRQTNLLK